MFNFARLSFSGLFAEEGRLSVRLFLFVPTGVTGFLPSLLCSQGHVREIEISGNSLSCHSLGPKF